MAHTEETFEPLMNGGKQHFCIGELEVGDEQQSGELVKGTFKGVHTESEPLTMQVGLVEMADGSSYAGWFEDNEKDYGVLCLPNGARYYGFFVDDWPENGIAIFPDGSVMIAENFDKNGCMSRGLFYWPDRARWLSAETIRDGMVIEGEYVEGDVISRISERNAVDLRAYHL